MTILFEYFEALFGSFSDRRRHKLMLQSIPSIEQAIDNICNRWDISKHDGDGQPIFIFSAGWRSGSTLLQRLVLSKEKVLIWGEPYAHCDLIRKLGDSIRAFQGETPNDNFFIDYYLDDAKGEFPLSDSWIANLYPMPLDLIESHRELFRRLYEEPAKNLGFNRWGLKEVRLNAEYALYLKFLFPSAKFLFLYRNPYNCYRSYKTFRTWYDRWPNEPVFNAKQFGAIWNSLTESFFSLHTKVDGLLISYEDMAANKIDYSALENYLEVDIDKSTIDKPVPGKRMKNPNKLSKIERSLLRSSVDPLASKLGYNDCS